MRFNRWDKFFFWYVVLGLIVCVGLGLNYTWWIMGLAAVMVVKIFKD